jgi:hypothetical protein
MHAPGHSESVGRAQVLLRRRRALDPLAYRLHNGWDERGFFELTEMTRDDNWRRYDGVVHLQTAAVGAERHYLRWPGAHRHETLEQAREIDRFCGEAWNGHNPTS